MGLPDFGMALRQSGHTGKIERPFGFKGVGRVDQTLYTIEALGEIHGVGHIINIDLDEARWNMLLAVLLPAQRSVVKNSGEGVVEDFVALPFVAAAYFTYEFGEEQEGDGETFLPLRALAMKPVTRVELAEDRRRGA